MLAKKMSPTSDKVCPLSGVEAGQLHPRTDVLPDPIAMAHVNCYGAGWSVHISDVFGYSVETSLTLPECL
jgi:hypothetical protein